LEENLFMKPLDEFEGSDGLTDEEKDFLKNLEKISEEIDAEGSDQ